MLPVICNVLKKKKCIIIVHFVVKFFLKPCHFCYRSKRSTVVAVFHVVEIVSDRLTNNELVACTFADLSKPFDKVDN